jgi:5-(carboxyamino)imidazole ribonucleotide mutase
MGSKSDWPTLSKTAEVLDALEIAYHAEVVSAHRTPRKMLAFAGSAREHGFEVLIAGAGGAAHLPGMVASMTDLPVLGVPVHSRALGGLDSLLSIVQMPRGVPVATLAIGEAGAVNAGLLAASILGLSDPDVASRYADWRARQTREVLDNPDPDPDGA